MHWIVSTIFMMCASVVAYTIVRHVKSYNLPTIFTAFAMISLPIPLFFALWLTQGSHETLTLTHWIVMFLQGTVLIYFGNNAAIKGIEHAPNPGYSVLLSKIYVIFTAPLSVVFFDAPLPVKSIIAILIMIGFSYLVIVEKSTQRKTARADWVFYTLIAFICFGVLALTSKYLLNQGVSVYTRLLIPGLVTTVLYIPSVVAQIPKIKSLPAVVFIELLAIGGLAGIFNYMMQYSFSVAPNVGFVNAANAASTGILALVSALVFKDELSRRKGIGIIGVLAGLVLLFS